MASRPDFLGRRTLIGALAIGVGALSFSAPRSARAAAPKPPKVVKATKQQVQYQDAPMDIRMCATCSSFEAPKSCKVVEGDVSKKGWCTLFALVD